MRDIRKKIVTDEHGKPLAVQIDYADWLEIERQLGTSPEREEPTGEDTFERALEETKGLWKEGDGLEFQRRLRAEWDR